MNGKGQTPRKGYNWQAYAANYDAIFRRKGTQQNTQPMKIPDNFTDIENSPDFMGNVIDAPTPRTDGDERQYPLPEHAQRIVFEGCDSVVMSPEEYEALYELARTLERELTSAQAALAAKDAEIGMLRCMIQDGTNAMKERDQLRAEVERLEAEVELDEELQAVTEKSLAAAKEDTERLDWLSGLRLEKTHTPQFGLTDTYIMCALFRGYPFNHEPTPTLRAAIDAARAGTANKDRP